MTTSVAPPGEMTAKGLHILRHSIGLNDKGHGKEYRNHYCTGKDCDSYKDCCALADLGLMQTGGIDGTNIFFHVTEAGKAEARKNVEPVKKLTRSQKRYQAFLHAESGLTFIEFLTTPYYADYLRRNNA